VESTEGAGSTFTVLIPARGATAALESRGEAAGEQEAIEGASGAVLIIDDEDVVRRAARATLEHYGFTVFEASDGQDGADLFSRLHDRISAVLLDLTMPRMDGRELWNYIRRIRPDMSVLISSGFEQSDAMKHFAADPALHFIQKPYTAEALGRKIMRVLEARP
jgi:DNA-binding NtrC family response regulator